MGGGGGHHTCFCAKEQYGLCGGQLEASRRICICDLPTHYNQQTGKAPPCLLDISNDCCIVSIRRGKETTQILEGHHHLQGMAILHKGGLSPHLCLLLHQTQLIPFCSPHAEGSGRVASVERLPGHKHVAVWETGVGTVTFLQNHYHIPHVVVHKVNPGIGVICIPPPASLNGAPHLPGRLGRSYPVDPGV